MTFAPHPSARAGLRHWLGLAARMAAVLVAATLQATPATAGPTMYGLDWSSRALFSIDLDNGTTSTIGATSNTALRNSLALAADGTAYTDGNGVFGTLNMNTAAATLINGATGRANLALAFDAAGSTLYGLEFNSLGSLYTVNRSTGVAGFVGNTGLSSPSSLAINAANRAFTANTFSAGALREIDLATGAVIRSIGHLSEGLTSMSFDASGVLYGVGLSSDNLYRIDLATAATTTVMHLPYSDVRGLSFLPQASVPEPSALALSGLSLLALALSQRGRRR